MTDTLVILVKHPGTPPELHTIDHTLTAMQAVIAHGEYHMIELVRDGPPGLDLWANEEGKYAQNDAGDYLEPNISIFDDQDYVMGTVFIARSSEDGETESLGPEDIRSAEAWLDAHTIFTDAERTTANAIAGLYR